MNFPIANDGFKCSPIQEAYWQDNQSLKIQVARPGIEPGPLAPKAKSLTTRPPLLHLKKKKDIELHYLSGTTIYVFDIVATRAPKISYLRAQSKFWKPVK